VSTNATNIVLVHGAWADGSSWSKVIPILKSAGYNVTAVQMPLNSLADDIDTVKRAIDHIGAPLAGQMYSTGIKKLIPIRETMCA
jgi:pimeloyl-ACP methyl ester carboxylesterase